MSKVYPQGVSNLPDLIAPAERLREMPIFEGLNCCKGRLEKDAWMFRCPQHTGSSADHAVKPKEARRDRG